MALEVKNPPVKAGDMVPSIGGEDPLEEGMAMHSSILAWRMPRIREPGGVQFIATQRIGHD